MKKALFILIALFLFCNTGSAIVYTASQLGLSNIESVHLYDADNLIVSGNYPDGLDDKLSYVEISGSSYNEVYNHTIISGGVTSDGDIIFLDNEGQVFRKKISNPLNMDDYDLGVDVEKLADLASSTEYDMCLDADDNIYVAADRNVYKLTAPSYSSSIIYTIDWVGSGSFIVGAIAPHPDGLIILNAYPYAANAPDVIELWDGTTKSMLLKYEPGSYNHASNGIAATSDGDIYYTSGHVLKRLNYTDYLSDGMQTSADLIDYLDAVSDGLCIDSDGVIYAEDNDQIITYSTFGNVGGYGGFYSIPSDSGDDSSSSSNTTSPFGDSHEWTNDEIATSSRQIVPPIFYIVLIFFLVYVIGGN